MRTALLLQMTYPGKKMLFMGTEFAQFSEWNYKSGLEWFMLDYPQHRAMRDYVAALGHFYLSNRELWEIDFSADGFRWIDADDAARDLISFIRRAADGSELIVILTFSGDGAADVRIPAAKNGRYNVVFESFGTGEKRSEIPAKKDADGWHIKVSLPPFSGIVLRLTGYGKQRRILFDKKKTEDAYVL
jgi:1,4-alpha-glucan branching enzyme